MPEPARPARMTGAAEPCRFSISRAAARILDWQLRRFVRRRRLPDLPESVPCCGLGGSGDSRSGQRLARTGCALSALLPFGPGQRARGLAGIQADPLPNRRQTRPQWLPQQRYATRILATIIGRRRTLTGEMRDLADYLRLPL